MYYIIYEYYYLLYLIRNYFVGYQHKMTNLQSIESACWLAFFFHYLCHQCISWNTWFSSTCVLMDFVVRKHLHHLLLGLVLWDDRACWLPLQKWLPTCCKASLFFLKTNLFFCIFFLIYNGALRNEITWFCDHALNSKHSYLRFSVKKNMCGLFLTKRRF